ncbi:MAG: leucine-rich repeat protein [Prevotella sp.]|nr:leucine-rich repeat protein [Prevotella sp.]
MSQIGDQPFGGSNLSNLIIEDGDAELVFKDSNPFNGINSCTIENVYWGRNVSSPGVFKGMTSLKTLTIGDKVTDIPSSLCYGCSNLTSVVIGSGLTKISGSAFFNCTNLNEISFPENITEIGGSAFWGCIGLKNISIPSGITSIGYCAFWECEGLTTLSIECGVIGEKAFYGCTALNSLSLGNKVSSIGEWAFRECTALTSVSIPNSVTSIRSFAFEGTGITSLTIEGGTEPISIGEQAFSCNISTLYLGRNTYCDWREQGLLRSALKYLSIGENVTSFSAFGETCNSLTSVEAHRNSIIVDGAFSSCPSLSSVSILSDKIGDGAFSNCISLESVEFGENVTSIGESAFYNASSLQTIVIPNSVTDIGDGAFYGCSNLSTLDIQATSLTINSNWFNGCGNIATISIAGGAIGESAFKDRKKLTSLTLGEGVTSIGRYAFRGCSSLPSVTLPNSLVTIGESAFAGTTSLLAIAIPNSVTSIGRWAFEDSGALEAVHITDMAAWCGITFGENWNGYSSDEGFNLYLNDEKVTSLIIPKEATTVNPLAFYNCKDIESITVEGNEVYDSRQGCNAIIETESNTLLKGCKSSFVPSDVTAIADYAFLNCDGLTAVTLGREMQSIGQQAFDGCKLRNVLVKNATPPTASGSSFSAQTFYHTTLYIPTGSWDDYAYDNNWYKFINIRETATTEAQLTMTQAYTLMDANKFCYSVYDPVNDCISTISTVSGIDENNPNHCWQVIEADGSRYLYNIGAKKFAVSSGGGFVLSDVASSIEMEDGADGIVLGEQQTRQWAMVSNERMSVEQNVIDDINTGMQLTTLPQQTENRYYDLNGRQLQQPKKGLTIVRTTDGRIVKSFKK